jgi:hypothetical protein
MIHGFSHKELFPMIPPYTHGLGGLWQSTRLLGSMQIIFSISYDFRYILVVGSRQDSTQINNGGSVRLFSCPFADPPRQASQEKKDNKDVNIAVGVVVAVVALVAVIGAVYFVWRRKNKGYTKSEL